MKDGKWYECEQVDVKELVVGNVVAKWDQQQDREELNHSVEFDEFERLERGRHRRSSFPKESDHTLNVLDRTSEWCRD